MNKPKEKSSEKTLVREAKSLGNERDNQFEAFDAEVEIDWESEISALQSQQFASLEDAVDALCDQVLQKVSQHKDTSEEMRLFIRGMILDNEEFCLVIQNALKIG